jgi:hypothetical protein
VESGGFQRGAKEGGQKEDGNRRRGNGEKRGKGCCGSNTTGGTAANAATPVKDDRGTQTEQRRRCNEERTDAGIEDGHAPPHTRSPRTSAVTLTLSEGAKMSYAGVIATTRRSIPLTEIDVKSVGMRKAVTGAIVIKVPGDKGREKASQLATHLSKVLDPKTVKVVEGRRS